MSGRDRPAVSVVMPFAGSAAEAGAALDALGALTLGDDDQLILADNSGTAPERAGVLVVQAAGERSPAHARNAGARRARADWLLFLDADCTAPAGLLDRFFAVPVGDEVGALAGAVRPAPAAGAGVAARYATARSFLDLDAHLAHPYLPRAAAANLLVRRSAFEAIGGFCEGVRAAEDTDLCWRLQRAGWRLEGRPEAAVEHRYRATLDGLRRQWRGYAAGRAWLARRYPGFTPEPGLVRAGRRALSRGGRRPAAAAAPSRSDCPGTSPRAPARDRLAFAAIDALLGLEELAGFAMSNRSGAAAGEPASVVLVADRLGAADESGTDDPACARARIEAAGRADPLAAAAIPIAYQEDDGVAERALALTRLLAGHPVRCALDLVTRSGDALGLAALAPAVVRLGHDDPGVRLRPLPDAGSRALAGRLARLSGRSLER